MRYYVEVNPLGTFWYKDPEMLIAHREGNLPAYESVLGTTAYFIDGNFHRTNGPAILHADGSRAWYINGRRLDQVAFNAYIAEMEQPKPTVITAADAEELRAKLRRLSGI